MGAARVSRRVDSVDAERKHEPMGDCWSCGAERGRTPFCGSCGLIQSVSNELDYYNALGLSRRMGLERVDLDRAFREASKRVHPDGFSKEEPELRRLALRHTELVNRAYKTLRDPRTRGEYLLSLEGVDVASETERTDEPDFLMALLERQEAVQSASNESELEALRRQTQARYDELLGVAAKYFDDREGEQGAVRRALTELRYERRMLDQISRREEELF